LSAIGTATSYPAVKFTTPGDTHWGTIVKIADVQATDFKTKQPLVYPDQNPVLQTVLTIEKADGEKYRVFVKAGAMRTAAVQALNSAQADDVELGGMIKFTFIGMEPAKNGGERKAFKCQYKKPPEGYVPPASASVEEFKPGVVADEEIPDTAFGGDDEPPW
jgi:hypothetical protein